MQAATTGEGSSAAGASGLRPGRGGKAASSVGAVNGAAEEATGGAQRYPQRAIRACASGGAARTATDFRCTGRLSRRLRQDGTTVRRYRRRRDSRWRCLGSVREAAEAAGARGRAAVAGAPEAAGGQRSCCLDAAGVLPLAPRPKRRAAATRLPAAAAGAKAAKGRPSCRSAGSGMRAAPSPVPYLCPAPAQTNQAASFACRTSGPQAWPALRGRPNCRAIARFAKAWPRRTVTALDPWRRARCRNPPWAASAARTSARRFAPAAANDRAVPEAGRPFRGPGLLLDPENCG